MGLVFMGDRMVVLVGLRTKLPDLHLGHADITKMTAEIFLWPRVNRAIENKVKDCIACIASGKNLKNEIPSNHHGKFKQDENASSRRYI